MLIFDLTPSHPLGLAICHRTGCEPAPLELRTFHGGEHKMRPRVSVRGRDVYVLSCLHGADGLSVNDHLIRLFFFIATCRDHGAARVAAVVPLLPYARKDRVTKDRDPVSSRYVAQLFEAVGTAVVVTLDVHNLAAFQNGFRCPTVHLDSSRLMADEISRRMGAGRQVVMSPDAGGMKRAEALRSHLELQAGRPVGLAFMEKHRSGGVVHGTLMAGDVAGSEVWIADDMIESGETMLRAVRASRISGASHVHLVATHFLGRRDDAKHLLDSGVDSLMVTDSAVVIPPEPTLAIHNPSVAGLFGAAVLHLHDCQGNPAAAQDRVSRSG